MEEVKSKVHELEDTLVAVVNTIGALSALLADSKKVSIEFCGTTHTRESAWQLRLSLVALRLDIELQIALLAQPARGVPPRAERHQTETLARAMVGYPAPLVPGARRGEVGSVLQTGDTPVSHTAAVFSPSAGDGRRDLKPPSGQATVPAQEPSRSERPGTLADSPALPSSQPPQCGHAAREPGRVSSELSQCRARAPAGSETRPSGAAAPNIRAQGQHEAASVTADAVLCYPAQPPQQERASGLPARLVSAGPPDRLAPAALAEGGRRGNNQAGPGLGEKCFSPPLVGGAEDASAGAARPPAVNQSVSLAQRGEGQRASAAVVDFKLFRELLRAGDWTPELVDAALGESLVSSHWAAAQESVATRQRIETLSRVPHAFRFHMAGEDACELELHLPQFDPACALSFVDRLGQVSVTRWGPTTAYSMWGQVAIALSASGTEECLALRDHVTRELAPMITPCQEECTAQWCRMSSDYVARCEAQFLRRHLPAALSGYDGPSERDAHALRVLGACVVDAQGPDAPALRECVVEVLRYSEVAVPDEAVFWQFHRSWCNRQHQVGRGLSIAAPAPELKRFSLLTRVQEILRSRYLLDAEALRRRQRQLAEELHFFDFRDPEAVLPAAFELDALVKLMRDPPPRAEVLRVFLARWRAREPGWSLEWGDSEAARLGVPGWAEMDLIPMAAELQRGLDLQREASRAPAQPPASAIRGAASSLDSS